MYLTRHRDMLGEVKLDSPIIVFGAGSIGSYATLALAKLGYTNITVLDDGRVDEENIAPQFYRPKDVGELKVDCLKRSIREQTGTDIITIPLRYDSNTFDSIYSILNKEKATIILTVDSMEARGYIFSHVSAHSIVDARMAIEFLTIISTSTGTRQNIRDYRDTLFADSVAVQEACTNKAISYTSLIAGGLVAKAVLDLHRNPTQGLQTVNFDITTFDMVVLK